MKQYFDEHMKTHTGESLSPSCTSSEDFSRVWKKSLKHSTDILSPFKDATGG